MRSPGRHHAEAASGRTDRLADLHSQLTHAVEDLTRTEAWQRMLTVAARLPTYSASNVLLIATQRPDATRVAGFNAWRSLSRHVRKGETGIAILAPCLYRSEQDTNSSSIVDAATTDLDRSRQRQLRGFRVVYVFDVSQTEGEPLPDVAPAELAGDAPEQLWDRLVEIAQADGFTLERGSCQGAYGYTRFDDCTIRIRADIDPAQAVKTLSHELAHIRADHEARFLDDYHRSPACRGRAEVEAESIAYLITTVAGMNTSEYSVPYVANWSGGDTAILQQTAATVLATGHDLVRALQSRGRGGDETPANPPAPDVRHRLARTGPADADRVAGPVGQSARDVDDPGPGGIAR